MAVLASLEEDTTARTAALNFLLSAGLLKPMKSTSGKLQFRGVGKKESDVYVLIVYLSTTVAQGSILSQQEGSVCGGESCLESYTSIRK